MLRTDLDEPLVRQAPASRGFAAAVQPVAQQTITTDGEGLVAGPVTIAAGDIEMPAYRAMPASGKAWPIVIVVSEIFGVHEHIADVARRFAKLGYLAVAPELFVRQGDAKAAIDIDTLFATVISKVPDAQVLRDLDASVAWAAKNGGDVGRLGVTGFCWGGRVTWLYAAHSSAVRAGVAWYGRLTGPKNERQSSHPVDAAATLQAPVLGLYGGADAGIPIDTVEAMKQALAAGSSAARRSQIVVYPDAKHAFYADYRPNYDADAAADGWRRCLEWMRALGVA
ncbi:MAG TPA: dienelactone hydrolase family protein [Caldimonas sp.]|nr:dienelactone hydrolase family protein [Caldimonas sp.]